MIFIACEIKYNALRLCT